MRELKQKQKVLHEIANFMRVCGFPIALKFNIDITEATVVNKETGKDIGKVCLPPLTDFSFDIITIATNQLKDILHREFEM